MLKIILSFLSFLRKQESSSLFIVRLYGLWIPAFAGMTGERSIKCLSHLIMPFQISQKGGNKC